METAKNEGKNQQYIRDYTNSHCEKIGFPLEIYMHSSPLGKTELLFLDYWTHISSSHNLHFDYSVNKLLPENILVSELQYGSLVSLICFDYFQYMK